MINVWEMVFYTSLIIWFVFVVLSVIAFQIVHNRSMMWYRVRKYRLDHREKYEEACGLPMWPGWTWDQWLEEKHLWDMYNSDMKPTLVWHHVGTTEFNEYGYYHYVKTYDEWLRSMEHKFPDFKKKSKKAYIKKCVLSEMS